MSSAPGPTTNPCVAPSCPGGRDAMGQPVRGHDRRRAGQAQELDQEQTERPAAEHPGAAADAHRRQVERMERHAERLEQG